MIGGFLVFAALTSTAGVALASKTVIKAKGADATGSFDVQEVQTCVDGWTASSSMLVGSAGPRMVTLVATLRLQNLENNSVATRSFGMVRSPSFLFMTRGRGTSNATSVTGQLTLDGSNLITPQASIDSDIETGTTANVEITR